MNTKYLIIGQGSIGQPVAENLAVAGQTVVAVAQSAKTYTAPVDFIKKDATTLTISDVAGVTHIAIIVTPKKTDTKARASADDYRASYLAVCESVARLAKSAPDWADNLAQVLFVSSTAVYGENDGEQVDESTPANPNTPTASVLKEAEDVLMETFGKRAVIVRASGIYGRERLRMLRMAQDAAGRSAPIASHQWTNRIMDTDLIHVVTQILLSPSPKSLYIATDDCPVTSSEVLSFIAGLLHLPAPSIAESSPSGKRIRGNVSQWLSFPSYQEGYQAVVAHQKAHSAKL